MAINFPDNPTIGQEFSSATGRTWIWTGSTWKSKSVDIEGQISLAIAEEVTNRDNAIAVALNTAEEYTDNAVAVVSGSLSNLSNSFTAHDALTANVHGIVDTSQLVTTAQLDLKQDIVGNVSSVEIGYLDGVTSSIQLQLDSKSDSTHQHSIADVANLSTELSGKADSIHEHLAVDITDLSALLALKSDTSHGHVISDVANLATELSSKSDTGHTHVIADVTSLESELSGKANTLHAHIVSDVTGLQSALDGKASSTHLHTILDVDDLQTALDGKSDTSHGHSISDIANLQTLVDGKANLSGATFTGDLEIPNVTITGNLLVQGTTTTIDTTNYTIRDNMLYMNQAGAFAVTNAVGNGTTVTYTAPGHDFVSGDFIVVTGINPSGYNIAGTSLTTIDSVNGDDFVVTKTDTGTYVSGGTARGKSAANPDLGFAAGRTTVSGYGHTGIFRDATDATWKFFDGYTPEPDESLYIDTGHASFALAPIAASALTVTSLNVIGGLANLSTATIQGIGLDDLDDVGINSMSTGDVLYYNGSGWVNKYINAIPTKTNVAYISANTSTYTLVSDDAGKIIEIDNSATGQVIIPDNESYPIGTQIVILQVGSGEGNLSVTVQTPASQTLNYSPGNKLRGQWAAVTILKRSSNVWVLYGDLVA